MTDYVLFAVLFAALLHALWNALISHSRDKSLYTLALHLCSAAVAIPVLMVIGLPSSLSLPYLATSIALHGVYIYLLSKVYASGPFASSYILMRGTAPVFVTLMTVWHLDAGIETPVLLGLGILATGMYLVLYAHDSQPIRHLKSRQVQFALANAFVIAAYTVVDGLGARVSGNAVAYVFASALFEPFLVYYFGFRSQTAALKTFITQHAVLIFTGSVVSLSGYSIVLWAMTQAPIAAVSSLRETSVVFAAIISVLWFKEGKLLPVVISSFIVFFGIYLLKA